MPKRDFLVNNYVWIFPCWFKQKEDMEMFWQFIFVFMYISIEQN